MLSFGRDSSGSPKPIPFEQASESEVESARLLQAAVDRQGSDRPHLEIVAVSQRFFRNPFEKLDISQIKFDRSDILKRIKELCDLVTSRRIDSEEENDYGPYVGVSGIAFALHRASEIFGADRELSSHLLKESHELQTLTQRYAPSSSISLRYLLGRCGFLTVNLLTAFDLTASLKQIADVEKVGKDFANGNSRTQMWDELFCGRGGFLAAALMLRQAKRIFLNDTVIRGVLNAIIEAGSTYSRRNGSPSPLMFEYHGKEYFGAAHGVCGILQMLLNFHDYLDADQLELVRGAIDWLVTTQGADGNFPSSMGHIGASHHSLIHWCHGAPGFVLLFLSANRVFGDQKYLQVMDAALNCIWQCGFLRKGPGLCHGLSGNGYVFLLAFRQTKRDEYYHKARMFALIMFHEGFQRLANTPDCPFSLFEGWAGPICFLADLLEPQKAQFPLYPYARLRLFAVITLL